MNLKDKVRQNNFTVGIIGLGYVGLPLALEFAHKGIKVIGFDLDDFKIKKILKEKKSYIKHIPSEKIKSAVDNKKLTATTDFAKLPQADAVIICVPTPLNHNREPDMSYVVSTAEMIGKYLRKGQMPRSAVPTKRRSSGFPGCS
ncbi:MAG: NAD(P)-binding domain-containing protein, partial [bacterium]